MVNIPGARESVAACSYSTSRRFTCCFPPHPADPAPPVLARAESRIRARMLLKINPNEVWLLGYFKARSIPSLVRGAVTWLAVLAQEGALLRVVGG